MEKNRVLVFARKKLQGGRPGKSSREMFNAILYWPNIMRLAIALDTTPDEFLVGTSKTEGEEWKIPAQYLRGMSPRQLELAGKFLQLLAEQDL